MQVDYNQPYKVPVFSDLITIDDPSKTPEELQCYRPEILDYCNLLMSKQGRELTRDQRRFDINIKNQWQDLVESDLEGNSYLCRENFLRASILEETLKRVGIQLTYKLSCEEQ